MVRLCSCGFATDDYDWLVCHLIDHPGHRETDSDCGSGAAAMTAAVTASSNHCLTSWAGAGRPRGIVRVTGRRATWRA
jgi:hypothetical protein